MDQLGKILSVAVGGAFGAVARYLINVLRVAGVVGKFPFPTFLINMLGSFAIGFLMILFTERLNVGENLRFALIVGFLGAFTTFSTFELEIFDLVRERLWLLAGVYLLASVLVGFAGVVAGATLAKRLI